MAASACTARCTVMTKKCIKCDVVKMDADFHKNSHNIGGRVNVCKMCKALYDIARGLDTTNNNALLRNWSVMHVER